MDNCYRENKKKFVLGFICLLVERKIFEKVRKWILRFWVVILFGTYLKNWVLRQFDKHLLKSRVSYCSLTTITSVTEFGLYPRSLKFLLTSNEKFRRRISWISRWMVRIMTSELLTNQSSFVTEITRGLAIIECIVVVRCQRQKLNIFLCNHSHVLVVNVCYCAAPLTRSLVFVSPRSRDYVRLFVLAVTFCACACLCTTVGDVTCDVYTSSLLVLGLSNTSLWCS